MDPSYVVLEISSDEEINWEDHIGKGITDDGDDHNWLAELLDEVNKENSGENGDGDGDGGDGDVDGGDGDGDGGGDSDEVVVVGEVLPVKKPRKKSTSKSSTLVDFDDDCVILDNYPDKGLEIRNEDPNNGNGHGDDDDGDSDDLCVVGEKGQVACRDYPHPRHLCIKFRFATTPKQSHCNQCYCYVCDSLAPCLFWGNGSSSVDHCHATDKDEFWRDERKNSKNRPISKVTNTALSDQLPPPGMTRPPSTLVQPPSLAHNQFSRPSLPANFGVPNIISQSRNPAFVSRNKYQPSYVSRTRDRVHHNYSLNSELQRAVFKRTGSTGVSPIASRYPYTPPYRVNYRIPTPHRNPSNEVFSGSNQYMGTSQSNLVNTSVPISSQNVTSLTVNPLLNEPLPYQPELSGQSNPNTSFDFSQSLQSRPNLDPYLENPALFQPQMASSQPSYTTPSQSQPIPPQPSYPFPQTRVSPSITVSDYTQNLTYQENQNQSQSQSQSSVIPPGFADYRIGWPPSETNKQTSTESSQPGAEAPTNEPSLAGLVGYQCDNWMFDNQVVEPGSMDMAGAYGFNEFSPDPPAFIDTGIIFDF